MNSLDPFTKSVIQGLAEKLVSSAQAGQTPLINGMCSEVQFMHDLIGNMGFCMMGAHQIRYDNEQFLLEWRMGSGALMDTVAFGYNSGKDLFNLKFRRYTNDRAIIEKETEFLGIYNDMVIRLIEEQTGFYLRL